MLKIGSLLTRPPIPLVAVCRRGGAMADWEAKFSKEKKGIIVVVVNKSTEKWSKSQEMIEGGKIAIPASPVLERGQTVRFGLLMKSSKSFSFNQQWASSDGENVLLTVVLNKGGGRALGETRSSRYTVDSITKFERLQQKQAAMVQFSLVSVGDTAPNTARSIQEETFSMGSGDDSDSWSSEPEKAKMKVVIKPDEGSSPKAQKGKQRPRGRGNDLDEDEQMRIAIEESKRMEEERQARLQEDAALKEAMTRSMAEQKAKRPPESDDEDSDGSENGENPKDLCWKYLQQARQNRGIVLIDQGKFRDAMPHLTQAVAVIVQVPNAYQTFKAELTFATAYCQACAFLIEMTRLHAGGYYQQLALVAHKLAEIEVQPNHRLIHARVAIRTNFLLGNFGQAAKYLQLLLPANLPEKGVIESMLKECDKQGRKDNALPDGGQRLCYRTMRMIRTRAFAGCEFCKATYRPQLLTNCAYCNHSLAQLTD